MAIGASDYRRTTEAVVAGLERYVADFQAEGALWARIVRSYEPHGALRHVDTDEASAQPGVVAVVTAETLGEESPLIPMRVYRTERAERALQPVLARDRVRYVGEPYAVVLATSPFACEDAAELVTADVQPLPVSVDPFAPGADPLHEGLPGNVADRVRSRSGDVDAALARAAVRVQRTLHFGRQTACPMECRGLLALPRDGGKLTVVGVTKVKQFNQRTLAALLGIAADDIEFVEAAVGGSFGARGEFYPEDYLIPWLALHFGEPVKWLEDRDEHFSAMNHAREAWGEVEVGLGKDGAPVAIRGRITCDAGAYVRTNGLSAGRAIATHLPGPYRWSAWDVDVSVVLTNKTPVGTYRAPGAVEATYFREVVVDEALRQLGRSPVESKRSWLPTASEMPHVVDGGADEVVVESGDWPAMWDAAMRAPRPGTGEGVGSAPFFVEEGFGPADSARVRADRDGLVVVEVGAGGAGQGVETALAQVAADALGLSAEFVRVVHRELGDPPANAGTFGSRVIVFTGSAVHAAALDFAARVRDEAAARFGCRADEVQLSDNGVGNTVGGQTIGFAELSSVGEGSFDRATQTATSGVAFASVEVEPSLLKAKLTRLALAVDVGRAINPRLAEQQIIGGAMQGIGGALLEEIRYDEFGQPQASFMDYHVPLACHLPDLDVRLFEFPAASNPLGAKGAGEVGIVGVAAAIANAIADAVGRAPLSVPCTPAVLLATLTDHPVRD